MNARIRRRRGAACRWVTAILLGITVAVTGCATTDSPLPPEAKPLSNSTSQPSAIPGAMTAPSPSGTAAPTAAPDTCADGRPVRASVDPANPMPVPGQMPPGSAMAAIVDRGYLRVGISTDVPPFGSMNWQKLELEGFDVDIAKEIAKALFGTADGRVRFQAVTIDDRINVISRGDVDIVVAIMTITCERKQKLRFSGVYYESGLRLLVRRNAGFTRIEDLAGFHVCSTTGSTSLAKLKNLPQPAPALVAMERTANCLVAFQTGQVDAIATDDVILAGMASQDPYTEVLPAAFDHALGNELRTLEEPYGVAMRMTGNTVSDDQFVAFVNGVLRNVMQGGRWKQIYDRWLGAELGSTDSPLAKNANWPH
ncbi:glutamate ABC transporter substrate-binding protein [Protofrankia symbiont of Coriaria ruscifolia]|uniref:Periplasmic component of amino acid ABC-type transporter/signal transduction system n=1 Tax=Candidatus Protofrankia californiensis TaxID=1839754 RepID=A0A1C3P633_9ACTN|nr:glutamate ABC transporter substrate-binding protein [Protofrankia symbiont of Coriaria ruscifolia]SBW25263.1 periplasmic component of amino acid ABC-type transporter/signal transduction system [Candidatus Protofrankia californiensis]